MPTALAGLRVLDFSRLLAGPFSTPELADLGAEVIKVEAPVLGDDSRHYMTSGEGAFHLSTNRNKKSIVVENYSNGVSPGAIDGATRAGALCFAAAPIEHLPEP